MANANNPEKLSFWDKVVKWYASNAYAVNIIYSVGASVVIVGALFKILHWRGASEVLMVGMFTEAFLFILGIFEKPHASYHWENVFPQLVGSEVKEIQGGSGISGVGSFGTGFSASAAPAPSVPSIPQKELDDLKEGIKKLGATASQLADLGKIAEGSQALAAKMQTATVAVDQLAQSQAGLAGAAQTLGAQYQQITAGMQAAVQNTDAYGKGVAQLNQQLTSLNSVYQLQLNSINQITEAQKAQAAAVQEQTAKVKGVSATLDGVANEVAGLQQQAAAAAQASKEYAAAQKKLAEQVANLNTVYGNMLNAVA